MAAIREFNLVKLFIGVLLSDAALANDAELRLADYFGPIDLRSNILPFDFTNYYEREMGSSIQRLFFSFERLIGAELLPEIKERTNSFEKELAKINTLVPRPVNLDPGYIEHAKVIVASTKNFYHRIYLGRGIFGEVTMHFRGNGFQFFPWTYPDYQSPSYQEFFLKMRQIYRDQLKTMCVIKQSADPAPKRQE